MFKHLYNKYFRRKEEEKYYDTFNDYYLTVENFRDEKEIYIDIKHIDVNLGVSNYNFETIVVTYEKLLTNPTRYTVNKYMEKFLQKSTIEEGIMYIDLGNYIIRLKNSSIKNNRVIRIMIRERIDDDICESNIALLKK